MVKLDKIGVQLYTVRDFIDTEENTKRTFEKIKALGYDEIQLASRKISYEAMGRLAKEAGLTIVGTHDDFWAMYNDPKTAVENHKLLGTNIMGIGGFFQKTVEEYEQFIERSNTIGRAIAPYGFKFSYHNHSHEFMRFGDKTIMDLLVEKLDPTCTSFVLDTYWVQHGGGDVRYWIEKLAGRIDILHLKDMKRIDAEAPHLYCEIGNGNLYWEGILETALKTGVKSFIVEQDVCPGDPFDSLKISSDYLHANFM